MKEKILQILETNSKLTIEEIASKLNISKEETEALIVEMEADKIICGYTAIVNWDKLDNELVNALIEVSVTPRSGVGYDNVANKIAKYDEVDSIYLISGDYDYLLQIKGKSMKEIAQFVYDKLSQIDDVTKTSTHFVLKKYKDHGLDLNDKQIDKRVNNFL